LYELRNSACRLEAAPLPTEAPLAPVAQPAAAPPASVATPAPPAPTAVVAAPPPRPAAAADDKKILLRDPASGETCPLPSNYRFAKKWVKEALVQEGLLKKIYKNSELNAEASAAVKEALEQFKRLDQYHA
jgi:hypothetical protein